MLIKYNAHATFWAFVKSASLLLAGLNYVKRTRKDMISR